MKPRKLVAWFHPMQQLNVFLPCAQYSMLDYWELKTAQVPRMQ